MADKGYFDRFFAAVYFATRYFATGQAPTQEEIDIFFQPGKPKRKRRPRTVFAEWTLAMDDEAVMALMAWE
jgi:hypothetical protein